MADPNTVETLIGRQALEIEVLKQRVQELEFNLQGVLLAGFVAAGHRELGFAIVPKRSLSLLRGTATGVVE